MSHVQSVIENDYKMFDDKLLSNDIMTLMAIATAYIYLKHQHVLVICHNVSIIQQ